MKKVPLRTCVVTRECLPKQDLVRIVRDKDGNVNIDLAGKQNGRGVYLKKDAEVILKARKKNILSHALNCEVDDKIYEELLTLVK